jgi:rhodanese-related sulfurtransferase
VLADWDGVRALTTGAWLAQLGWEVFTHVPPALAPQETGAEPVRVLASHAPAPQLSVQQAQDLLGEGRAIVFDVDSRPAFEKQHIAGARFAVPDRLASFVQALPPAQVVVLTSPDGVLARSVAAELAARTGRDVRSVVGGTSAWAAAGLPLGQGDADVLTGDDDQWYSPYAHRDLALRDAGFQAYLDWELGLVEQLGREGHTGIRLLPALA